MNKCEKCGFLHYRTDPCRKPKESTAARKDVHLVPSAKSASGHEQDGRQDENGGVVRDHLGPEAQKVGAIPTQAGTQALPVDTNSGSAKSEGFDPFTSQATFVTTSVGMVGNEDRQPKFDKKAWMREYMREHRRGIRRRAAK